jgi:hypothetical protein
LNNARKQLEHIVLGTKHNQKTKFEIASCILLFVFLTCFALGQNTKTKKQPYAVDHLARESMKSAANCEN